MSLVYLHGHELVVQLVSNQVVGFITLTHTHTNKLKQNICTQHIIKYIKVGVKKSCRSFNHISHFKKTNIVEQFLARNDTD